MRCAPNKETQYSYSYTRLSSCEEENKGNRCRIITEDHRSTCRPPIYLSAAPLGIRIIDTSLSGYVYRYDFRFVKPDTASNAINTARTSTILLNLLLSFHPFRQIARTVFKASSLNHPDEGTQRHVWCHACVALQIDRASIRTIPYMF